MRGGRAMLECLLDILVRRRRRDRAHENAAYMLGRENNQWIGYIPMRYVALCRRLPQNLRQFNPPGYIDRVSC